MTKSLILATLLAPAVIYSGEVFRLKYPATVDVLDASGKVSGTRKLKAGTLVTIPDAAAAEAPADNPGDGPRLKPSDISPAMFAVNPPAAGAVLRAEIRLSDFFPYSLDSQKNKYWSVQVEGRNEDWTPGKSFWGYALRTSAVGKQLQKVLADGKEHRAHVKLKKFTKSGSSLDDLMTIEDLEILDP